MIWWPFPKRPVSQRFVPFGGILTITFAVNIHLAESNCFQMEIFDNMRVYSETPHWIHYHICFKHDQLQSDLSSFVQWRTRDYNELHLASIQTAETLSQTFHSTYMRVSDSSDKCQGIEKVCPGTKTLPLSAGLWITVLKYPSQGAFLTKMQTAERCVLHERRLPETKASRGLHF